MNILVFGGSYFLGKHFVNIAKEKHNITVFNRGNHPLVLPGVSEVVGDRHDTKALQSLNTKHYDAVVDFCGYGMGDIRTVFSCLSAGFNQYIFVSTCDVYERGLNRILDENAPLERRDFGGEAGQYITGKVALEEELMECAGLYGTSYTSIRPAFIYGPDNYAPREAIYFHWIERARQILHPVDATGEFQMVFVTDVARAVLNAIGNKEAFQQAYNLAPLPMITYESFSDALKEVMPIPFEKVPVTLQMVNEKQIPLPFPLTKEESNWYSGEKALQLIGSYTQLVDGLKQTVMSEIE